jgi:outer membrane protein OmpA-like peptidoglycan-associated protein
MPDRSINRRFLLHSGAIGLALLCGCAGPNAQLTSCQQDKEQLLTTIREQRDTTRALHEQVASLETRLDQAEKELARGGGATRLSSRPGERAPAKKSSPTSEPLPWRSPAEKKEDAQSGPEIRRTTNTRAGETPAARAKGSLLALARSNRSVRYDARSSTAQIDLPLAFEGATAALTAADKRQLDELARLLKSDEARDLRVMVAGFASGTPGRSDSRDGNPSGVDGEPRFASARQLGTARAQAVADYLDRHGIAQERLGVSGVGSRVAQANTSGKSAASGVQVYLLDGDAPVVGWGPTGQPLRR